MSVYTIGDINFQLRLEPIVSLHSGGFLGFEALSRVTGSSLSSTFDYEVFFASLSIKKHAVVVREQLKAFRLKCIENPGSYCGKWLFINLTPSVLEVDSVCQHIAQNLNYFPIAIEVDSHLRDISDKAKANVIMLQKIGAQIWIDDFLGDGSIRSTLWDGIKIDRFAFQDGFDELNDKVGEQRYQDLLNVAPLIIEGIENKEHLDYAKLTGACYGQGYYWAAN